ncbi:MAG: hypothetical protein ACREBE_21655, partial [bacterium]
PGAATQQAAPPGTATASHGAPPPVHKPSGPPAVMPTTDAGMLAQHYVAAFNSGDPNTMRTFIESFLVADPARPTDKRLESYSKLFGDFGPLSLVSVDSSTATKVTLGMQSKQGSLYLTVKTADADPKRAASVTFDRTEQRD